jgi:phage tail-like protein
MPNGNQAGVFVEPFRAYNFRLLLGTEEAYFTECSGMGIKVQAIKYREGGMNQVVRNLPGRVEYADVTLRYGLTNSPALWNWFMSSVRGRAEYKNVSIILLGNDGVQEVMRWNLMRAWASAWRGAVLDALTQEVAIESLTLVYETLERDTGR